ncbi:helix-turn-helix domain-containing protein [Microbulbifer aggregans]|uniref:helix-turn-helix domain-containing protein n=1 Tax=Microbulbifer aggregans TaxID=1769779 RepID=UPI001CFD9853
MEHYNLTIESVFNELSIRCQHVWNLIRHGKLKVFKVGRRMRISRGEINHFIAKNVIVPKKRSSNSSSS